MSEAENDLKKIFDRPKKKNDGILVDMPSFSDEGLVKKGHFQAAISIKDWVFILPMEKSMNAYSIDLRQRVLAACDAKAGTVAQIARRFSVTPRWIYLLKRQRKKEGNIEPRGHRGGRTAAFHGKLLATLDQFVQKHPGATLQAIHEKFSDRVSCSIVAIHNALRRLGWRYNKNRYERVNKAGQT